MTQNDRIALAGAQAISTETKALLDFILQLNEPKVLVERAAEIRRRLEAYEQAIKLGDT